MMFARDPSFDVILMESRRTKKSIARVINQLRWSPFSVNNLILQNIKKEKCCIDNCDNFSALYSLMILMIYLIWRGCVDTHTWYIVCITTTIRQESVPDLPGKDARTLSLVVGDLVHHSRSSHARLGSSDSSGLDGPCLVISEK